MRTCACAHCKGGATQYRYPPVHDHDARKFDTKPIPGCPGCAP